MKEDCGNVNSDKSYKSNQTRKNSIPSTLQWVSILQCTTSNRLTFTQ